MTVDQLVLDINPIWHAGNSANHLATKMSLVANIIAFTFCLPYLYFYDFEQIGEEGEELCVLTNNGGRGLFLAYQVGGTSILLFGSATVMLGLNTYLVCNINDNRDRKAISAIGEESSEQENEDSKQGSQKDTGCESALVDRNDDQYRIHYIRVRSPNLRALRSPSLTPSPINKSHESFAYIEDNEPSTGTGNFQGPITIVAAHLEAEQGISSGMSHFDIEGNIPCLVTNEALSEPPSGPSPLEAAPQNKELSNALEDFSTRFWDFEEPIGEMTIDNAVENQTTLITDSEELKVRLVGRKKLPRDVVKFFRRPIYARNYSKFMLGKSISVFALFLFLAINASLFSPEITDSNQLQTLRTLVEISAIVNCSCGILIFVASGSFFRTALQNSVKKMRRFLLPCFFRQESQGRWLALVPKMKGQRHERAEHCLASEEIQFETDLGGMRGTKFNALIPGPPRVVLFDLDYQLNPQSQEFDI